MIHLPVFGVNRPDCGSKWPVINEPLVPSAGVSGD